MMIKRGGSSGFSEGSPPTSPFRDSSVINQENRARKGGQGANKSSALLQLFKTEENKHTKESMHACMQCRLLTPFEVNSGDIDLLQFSQKVLFLNDIITQIDRQTPHIADNRGQTPLLSASFVGSFCPKNLFILASFQ